MCALLIGAALGVAVGGVYFTGAAAAAALSPNGPIARLSRAAKAGFSDEALDAEAASMSPGVLAAARRLDPYASAEPERDRQAALAAANAITRKPSAAARAPRPAQPFQFAGALESSHDLDCLSAAVYYEARGETAPGQAAVAQVVLNRTRHPAFPKTICGVVYQGANTGGCQFSFACDGSMRRGREPAAWERARAVAARALNGYVMADVGQAVSFHVASLTSPWGAAMIRVSQVGSHIFYRMGGRRTAIRGGVYAADTGRASATVTSPSVSVEAVTADGLSAVSLASAAPSGADVAAKRDAKPEAAPPPAATSGADTAKPAASTAS